MIIVIYIALDKNLIYNGIRPKQPVHKTKITNKK